MPFRVEIGVFYKVPKRVTSYQRAAYLLGFVPPYKPDADNVAKIILDALNGYAYEDDSQVTELTVMKRYDESYEGVRVTVTALEGGEYARV